MTEPKYKIMIHPMPESYRQCPCFDGCHCNYYEDEICSWQIGEKCDVLIPAEPWQFETCETCGISPDECPHVGYPHGKSKACKEWRAK